MMQRLLPHLVALFLFSGLSIPSFSQPIDKIIAIIGEDVILKSDIDNQYAFYLSNGEKDDGTLRCQLLENLVIEKLMVNKAMQDSVLVADGEVESELDRRINYFISGYGSVAELEKQYRKPLIEIKADLRPDIKKQLLAQKMKQEILSEVNVTPRDVKLFYKQLDKDSLEPIGAEVEVYHIVIEPKPSENAKNYALEKAEEVRKLVTGGSMSFEDAAKKYSDDLGSAKLGGNLGQFGRGVMTPNFEEVAYKVKENKLSEVFETPFGYHFLRVNNRVGETVDASHILIKPVLSSYDDTVAMNRLEEVRTLILADSLTFEQAAIKYSDDQATKSNGGCIVNPQSGEFRIAHDELDADLYFKVDKLEEGEVSKVMEWLKKDSPVRAFHMMYLKRVIPPHIPNLKDDYQKIQEAARQAKQFVELQAWFELARKNVYIEVKDPECQETLKKWYK